MIDEHTHCYHSHDSIVSPRDMIKRAIELNISYYAITDHYDLDCIHTYPGYHQLDLYNHFKEIESLKKEYKDQIEIASGVEVAWCKEMEDKYRERLSKYDFDITLDSVHLVNNIDCYDMRFYENKTQHQAYSEYIDACYQSLHAPYHIDVLTHFGYCVRKAPYENPVWKYEDYKEQVDMVLKTLIEKGIALECNTHTKQLPLNFLPTLDMLKRYKELGGELITFASDAHQPCRVLEKYDVATAQIKELGFKYLFKFIKHKPIAVKI